MSLRDKDRIASPQTRCGVYAMARDLSNSCKRLEAAFSSSNFLLSSQWLTTESSITGCISHTDTFFCAGRLLVLLPFGAWSVS